jgi:phenylpropionate dioxygenase-like ring-hydroxylating dioxygenase large terminal subunit
VVTASGNGERRTVGVKAGKCVMSDGEAQAANVARCPQGRAWADLVAEDSRPTPPYLAQDAYEYRGSEPIDAARYTSPEFFKAECEKMWPYVWQMAAREEDMPDPGDVVVYENVGRSYLVIRQPDGSVRAFHNVCLHRGRKLRTENGAATFVRCPYHGFAWNLDGSVKEIPCKWDFPHLREEEMGLPEAETGRWGGYIFVRENPGGPSLEEYLAPLPEHFARWPHEQRTTSVYVAKVIHGNWKAVMEAFMEAWHNYSTHPQITPFVADANSQYNIYGDHTNLALSAQGVLSGQTDPTGKSEQWIIDRYMEFTGRQVGARGNVGGDRADGPTDVAVPEGSTARKVLAQMARETYPQLYGFSVDHATDGEMLDAIYYCVFPNFEPWGGFTPSLSYRFRPWPDQDNTLMEVRILTPVAPGKPIPRSVPMRFLRDDEAWASSEEIGSSLGRVLDQDVANIEQVQAGLKVSKNGKLELGNYMEIRMRQFHQTLDKYLAGEL